MKKKIVYKITLRLSLHFATILDQGVIMKMLPNVNIFRVSGHLCREFTGDRWIPRTKASEAELWWNG